MKQPTHHDETRRLKALAADPNVRFKWTGHALKEMTKDQIYRDDVKSVLKKGLVHRVEYNQFEETWNCRGADLDGRKIEVVVVVYDGEVCIKVVTTWAL